MQKYSVFISQRQTKLKEKKNNEQITADKQFTCLVLTTEIFYFFLLCLTSVSLLCWFFSLDMNVSFYYSPVFLFFFLFIYTFSLLSIFVVFFSWLSTYQQRIECILYAVIIYFLYKEKSRKMLLNLKLYREQHYK